jgi:hypothetical protein
MEPQRSIRRIVTGNDEQGRSRIIEDGPSPAVRTVQNAPVFASPNCGPRWQRRRVSIALTL